MGGKNREVQSGPFVHSLISSFTKFCLLSVSQELFQALRMQPQNETEGSAAASALVFPLEVDILTFPGQPSALPPT